MKYGLIVTLKTLETLLKKRKRMYRKLKIVPLGRRLKEIIKQLRMASVARVLMSKKHTHYIKHTLIHVNTFTLD